MREIRKGGKGENKAGRTITQGRGMNCWEIKANKHEAYAFGKHHVPSKVLARLIRKSVAPVPNELLRDFAAQCLLKTNSGCSVLISEEKETHT